MHYTALFVAVLLLNMFIPAYSTGHDLSAESYVPPWVVHVFFYEGPTEESSPFTSSCVGLLISLKHVLTACRYTSVNVRISSFKDEGEALNFNIENVELHSYPGANATIIPLPKEISRTAATYPLCIMPETENGGRTIFLSRYMRTGMEEFEVKSMRWLDGDDFCEDLPYDKENICLLNVQEYGKREPGDSIVYKDDSGYMFLLAITEKKQTGEIDGKDIYRAIWSKKSWIDNIISGYMKKEYCKS